jgi:hypothetical protein
MGLQERRDPLRQERLRSHPHPLPLVVDGAWYLARYPDVLGAGLDPLHHLLGSGLAEGRDPSPYVDLSFYATMVPRSAGDRVALFDHLLATGLASGVPTSAFVDLPGTRRITATRPTRSPPSATS